jgi:hypothetical protein
MQDLTANATVTDQRERIGNLEGGEAAPKVVATPMNLAQ